MTHLGVLRNQRARDLKDNSGCRGTSVGPKSIWSEHLKELSRAAVVLGGGSVPPE